MNETVGTFLKRHRESKPMTVAELARMTRIPVHSLEAIEQGRFDDLPGEVFVKGFLRSYASAVGLSANEVVARYTASRRVVELTPLALQPAVAQGHDARTRRFGVAIAFVLLLVLFTLAISMVLRPRGHNMPHELSSRDTSSAVAREMMVKFIS